MATNHIPFDKLQKKDFLFGATSLADIRDKYIKIDNKIYFMKMCNQFGDMALMKITETGYYENIGNVFPSTKRTFKICFKYEGFSAEHKIKYFDVKYLNE